eukprot:10664947-Alexandrium_andersonii.AAC.1
MPAQPLTRWRDTSTPWRKAFAHVERKCTCAIVQFAFRRLVYVSQHARTVPLPNGSQAHAPTP